MRRYLVVANQTVGGTHLTDLVKECLDEDECSFYVVVPASPSPDKWAHAHDDAHDAARERLERALERFRGLGVDARGEVGDTRPEDAIRDVLRRESFDEIILSTLPPGMSRWLKMDLVSRVQRAMDVPVRHLISAPDPQPAS